MSKGFIFSLDSVLSVAVISIFLATFSFLSAQAQSDPYPLITLEKQANDLLIVLDKSGDLSTLNSSYLNISINSTLPSSVLWNLELEYYTYSEGFEKSGNFSIGYTYSTVTKLAHAQREFLVFENSSVKYYGLVRLNLWND